jgi:hypothetical protein
MWGGGAGTSNPSNPATFKERFIGVTEACAAAFAAAVSTALPGETGAHQRAQDDANDF